MKKITMMIICAFVCAALLTGCGSKKAEEETTTAVQNDEAVVGTWTENEFDSGYTFNSDGTGKNIFWDLTFTYTAVDGLITITYDDDSYATDKFNYAVTDSEIVLTRQSDSSKSYTYTR